MSGWLSKTPQTLRSRSKHLRRFRVLVISLSVITLSAFSTQGQGRGAYLSQSLAGDDQDSPLWNRLVTEVAQKLRPVDDRFEESEALARSDGEQPGGPEEQNGRSTGDSPLSRDDAPAEVEVSLRVQGDAAQSSGGDQPAAGKEPQAEQSIKVGVNDRVTMHVSGLPLADALRMLSEPTRRNIVLADGIAGTVTASLYNVTFDEALQAMLASNRLGYRAKGDFVYVLPLEDIAKMMEAERKVVTRVITLTYVNATSAKSLVEPLLSGLGRISVTPPSTVGLGGDSGPGDTKGDAYASTDTLVVTDFAEKVAEIEKILKQLDAHPKQVLVEATIMRATLDEDNALGIDFTTVGGIDFTELSSTSPAAQSITTGDTPSAFLEETTWTGRTEFNNGVPGGGFTFGIIKDQIGVFIRALEQITDTDVLANPKVLALNKQSGQVIVGRRDGYLTTTITETTAVQKVEFLETGTLLSFRPFVGDDGFVRMEIHPKDSTGGLTDANLPFEQTTEVTTNVLVKDGHTILIGGLFREVSTAGRGQVPGLGNIPIAGALFRRTRDSTVREEVIILLTVHVLKGEADAVASAELKEDTERFRVGMRQGTQWFGRDRLAQAHYRWAMEHLQNGNISMALWDAQLAIHNQPRHIQAAKLKEKLLGKRNWEEEASSIRTYVRNRILEEEGIEAPPYGRPAPPFVIPEGVEGPAGLEDEDDAAGNGATEDSGSDRDVGDVGETERERKGQTTASLHLDWRKP
jgi:type IV pilus assembly protein PilQ